MFFFILFFLYMAYFWVHSFASLLYLQREEKRAKSVDDNSRHLMLIVILEDNRGLCPNKVCLLYYNASIFFNYSQ